MKDKHHEPKQAKPEKIEEREEVRETKPIVWTDEMYYLDKIENQNTLIELLKEKVERLENQLKGK